MGFRRSKTDQTRGRRVLAKTVPDLEIAGVVGVVYTSVVKEVTGGVSLILQETGVGGNDSRQRQPLASAMDLEGQEECEISKREERGEHGPGRVFDSLRENRGKGHKKHKRRRRLSHTQ